MYVKDEEVMIVAREIGQRTRQKNIFENLEEGIFFKVSDENHKLAESKLVEVFSF